LRKNYFEETIEFHYTTVSILCILTKLFQSYKQINLFFY